MIKATIYRPDVDRPSLHMRDTRVGLDSREIVVWMYASVIKKGPKKSVDKLGGA